MRTSLQAIIMFMMIVLAMVAVAVWLNHQKSGQILWILRIACPVIAIALLVILIQTIKKPDLVPDYLSMNFGSFFEQNGLLFHITPKLEDDDSFWLMIYFQNKHENPCEVNIVLHPKRAVRFNPISAKFTCEAAAFGVAKVPILDSSTRGQRTTWEIGATVYYPRGKRKQLRFSEGKAVTTNADLKKPRFHIFGLSFSLSGIFNWKMVKTMTFEIPPFINHDFAIDQITHTKTLWKLGDPPLT